jgi:5'-deoxynucleotidase YfbR-like HD superfamily hydrolase
MRAVTEQATGRREPEGGVTGPATAGHALPQAGLSISTLKVVTTEPPMDSIPTPPDEKLFAFFERLKTMSSIKRFGTLPMIESESVASHSYNVAIMALMIADYETELEINREEVLRKALFHDFEETILSDIPHPIKHRFKGGKLGVLLKEIVPELIEQEIFKELPERLKRLYVRSALGAKEDLEGQIVGAADAMDIVMTSLRELKMGNRYFENIFEVGIKMLSKYHRFAFARLFSDSAKMYREKGEAFRANPTFSDEFVS